MPVPLLDLTRQYQSLKIEIDAAVARVLAHSKFIMGPEVAAFEKEVSEKLGVAHAMGVASGSDALILALRAVGVGPGDEVIVPTFSFFATAGSVTHVGATPVFCDISKDDYNIDAALIEQKVTKKTKVIMPVHLFGQMPDMDKLRAVADAHHLAIVEDAAQAIGASYKGMTAGRWGKAGCFSFFPSKNLGAAGDGGMIISDDPGVADNVRMLRAHGAKPKYYHGIIGYNSRLDTIQAAILSVKLKHLDTWNEQRRAHADVYDKELAGVGDLILPKRTANAYHIYNQYTIATDRRDGLTAHLKGLGIGMEVYYPLPLHAQQCFAGLPGAGTHLPVAEKAAVSVVSIPIFPDLTQAEQAAVIDGIKAFFK
ncbi:MAG: DegT/DnrJ/EryC1/StrS family aminotransferase [candidate division Zixibacteria bacterium]|nr:DegT/DnrJ/EryC1/StrS family aminotransferase [candidate division Zixibacteria bacterium]